MKFNIYKIYLIISLILGLSIPASAYEPLLVEGRTWEYRNVGGFVLDLYIHSIKAGIEVEKYGKKYFPILCAESGDTLAFMREEPGKAYLLMQREGDLFTWDESVGDYTPTGSFTPDQESLVYDFTKEVGDSITLMNYPWYYNTDNNIFDGTFKADLELTNKYTDTYFGVERIYQEWTRMFNGNNPVKHIEGIGILEYNLLPFYISSNWFMTTSKRRCKHCFGKVVDLNRVYEKDGTVIYDSFSDVPIVERERVDDGRMYDLSGREIREPQRGTVYIQGGRKMVKR